MKAKRRRISRVWAVVGVQILLTLVAPCGVSAQPVDIAVTAGVGSYATGDEFNCGSNGFLGLGVELRTRGRWLVSLGGDLLLASALDCTDVLTLVPKEDGVLAGEFTGLDLGVAPRMRAFLGARIRIAAVEVAPAVGVGLLRSGANIPGEPRSWREWTGIRLAGRWVERGPSLIVEHGWNRVPVRHELFTLDDEGRNIELGVEDFGRWEPITQVMLSLTLEGPLNFR